MKTVQLDEDINSRKLVGACELEGRVTINRFPRELRGFSDPAMLQALLPRGVLLTIDLAMVDEHSTSIPERHHGIIIVGLDPGQNRTITTDLAMKIIRNFKDEVADWDTLDYSNSIVFLRQSSVEIGHMQLGTFVRDEWLDRTGDWSGAYRETLVRNGSL